MNEIIISFTISSSVKKKSRNDDMKVAITGANGAMGET
jgi:hypothetical protein